MTSPKKVVSKTERCVLKDNKMPVKNYIKLAVSSPLKYLPGFAGRYFEDRYYWALRSIRLGATLDNFSKVIQATPEGAVCIDAGANVGDITTLLAASAKKVYSFEPDPWSFQRLRENTIDLPNVEIFNSAVGAVEGRAQLMRDPNFKVDPEVYSHGSSIFMSNLWQGNSKEYFEVEVIDIFSFIRSLSCPIYVVKMDIEGAEVDILERALEEPWIFNTVDNFFVETHECQIRELRARTQSIRKKLQSRGASGVYLDWV